MNQDLTIRSADILNAKILIVDDQQSGVLLLERMLRGAGYVRVASTVDSRRVRELHLQNRYDLILLDLQMPGMDGFEVIESLKEIEISDYLPVLVVTAQPSHKLRALSAGARDFVSKPLDLAEVLMRVRNMIEVRLLHLETQRLYAQVVGQQKATEQLLLNVLPQFVAERLKGRPEVLADGFTEIIADSFPEATVLFADIVEFAEFSAGVSPQNLVLILNEIFGDFDRICQSRGLQNIKTSSHTYLAVAGIPHRMEDHAVRAAHMALDLIEAVDCFNERSGCTLQVRVGINSGTVVAGVIGTVSNFIYDVWGEGVMIASLMESQGVAGKVHLTQSTRTRLSTPFLLERYRGFDFKGKGPVRTWLLTGRSVDVAAVPAPITKCLTGKGIL